MILGKEKLPESAQIPVSDYVILGGTGDLAVRKILPALFWRFLDDQINHKFRIIVASRSRCTVGEIADKCRPHCLQALESNDEVLRNESLMRWQDFLKLFTTVVADVSQPEGGKELYQSLKPQLAENRPCIFYLAISPKLFGSSCQMLANAGLVLSQSRLVVEKPLGSDRESAKEINDKILAYFAESKIYRIDHYLGKETVQNLMALRFANVIFESQWNNHSIDHVQISVAESLGVESRADYYDSYGALRDMVQNHLLQLLCLVAMEPPARFVADQVRNEKLRVLNALRPIAASEIVRGQYKGYQQELGRHSHTETYVALKVHIDNWRWAGVPFYLRTGKKLAHRASEIVITFKDRPHDIFAAQPLGNLEEGNAKGKSIPNRLIIRLQPQEGLRLLLTSKQPGPGGMRLHQSELNLLFDETFDDRLPDAYERLLMDTARGNQTLFMRLDEVLAAWDYIDPIVQLSQAMPPQMYEVDTMGPLDTLLSNDQREWFDLEHPE